MAGFNPTTTISHRAHVTGTLCQYDMIIGRELLHKLRIDLHFSTTSMHWQDVEVSMKELTCTKEETFQIQEELFVSEDTDWIAKMLDAKYATADFLKLWRVFPN